VLLPAHQTTFERSFYDTLNPASPVLFLPAFLFKPSLSGSDQRLFPSFALTLGMEP